MLKKDSYILGAAIGVLLPILLFFLLYFGLELFERMMKSDLLNEKPAIRLISIGLNLLPLRYYFVNLKYDKTGMGILFVTFLYVVLFFIKY